MGVGSLRAQLVQIGPPDPNFCEKIEKQLKPNLELTSPLIVRGLIVDQTGAPFKFSRVELRQYVSAKQQRSIKAVSTDANGRFELGEVAAGRCRLLASPNRTFQQPTNVVCNEKSTCDVQLILKVNSTDLPESVSPIR